MNTYERKYSEDSKTVAVLYSPGYGAGWSTWANDRHREQMLFDKRLVEAAFSGVADIKPLIEEIFEGSYVYTGGWKNIRVAWVEKGERFYIEEYDGSERIIAFSEADYYTA